MNKSQAEDVSRRMAEAHSAKAKDSEETGGVYSRVHKAVFDHAQEMIPEAALFTVVDKYGEPKVLALHEQRLYVLTVGDVPEGLAPAQTICQVRVINPLDTSARCETKYSGHRLDGRQVIRETLWHFRVGDLELHIETFIDRSRDWIEDDEIFSQALAKSLGWSLSGSGPAQLASVA